MALVSIAPATFEYSGQSVEFLHAYQPIVDVRKGEIFAHEALLRGCDGSAPPSVMSSVPKCYYSELDQRIRETALVRAHQLGLDCKLSLNFSTSCLINDHSYLLKTLDYAEACGIAPADIIIEISESDVIHGIPDLMARLNEAQARGASVALDDFGAGYAGLNSLIDVNPDIIKLDMYLVRDIDSSGVRQATMRALVGLALDLGIELIAEGVETQGEFDFLRSVDIDLFQGFHLAKPVLCDLLSIDDISIYSN